MRVDLAKVKSLVNIGGELTIALSAFDQDMDDLGSMIGEIDRTHFRLKNSARDLELGYEGKAIEKVDIAGPLSENPDGFMDGEPENLSEFDLLELDRYSELSLIIRSLSETAADTGTISQQLSRIHSGFKGYLHHLRILLSELNEKTMRMRMTPMSSISNRMRRTVRETASQLNKKVHLTLKGEHIELDKLVWDKLAAPLMHLLRNAVDHGVESRAARRKAGKPETADIRLQAAYQGNQVVIRISDDGPGIDYDAIANATIAPDSVKNESDITQKELTDMIFQPGFSTRHTISEVSGRGVGLDVVKENILGLKGSVIVEASEKDAGTTFLIKLPITMAVIKALIFDIRGRRYATSLYDIKEILRVNPKDLAPQGDKTIYVSGRRLPYYDLSDILDESGPNQHTGDMTQWPLLLIIEKETWQGAVAIDRMYSQRDIVIKNLGNHLGQVKGIAGATVMGDGKVVPILNIEELVRVETDRPARPFRLKPKANIQKPLEIMVVDDSVTIRNVVSRLMKRQGWKVVTAKDGMEAIEALYARQPDVIILDVEMPRMNGYEFMSSIRAQEKFNNLPVIMHTSRASKKHREKAKALGVNGFVTKPYEEKDFIALVKELGRKDSE
jgi:chemosensory pili system protein ChpA (sensor histidine kinase/response regulator)